MSVLYLAVFYRASEGLARRRLQLLGAGLSLSVALGAVAITGNILFSVFRPIDVMFSLIALLIPATVLLAISKRALGVADQALLIALRISGITVFAATVLVIFVVGIGGKPEPEARASLALALLALGVIALLGLPLWSRMSRVTRALTYGDRPAPSDLPKDLALRLTRAVPREELLRQFAETLQAGLRLRSIEIWTVGGRRLTRSTSLPHQDEAELEADAASLDALARLGVTGRSWLDVWLPDLARDPERNLRVVPATFAGAVLAVVIAERDRSGDPFTPADDDLMTDAARRLGGLLHSHRLDDELQSTLRSLRRHADELQASRARIVAAADDERQRLERDLHDGAQQRLVALSVQLAVAREVLSEDIGGAEKILAELSAQSRDAIAELRTLAHGIYPPVLQASGLPDALADAVARAALPAELKLEHVGRYSREIESAVYFCCLEALQNAAKHAGEGSRVVIRINDDRRELRFEVIDDGSGFEPEVTRGGRGFTNMSDRLGAIGGRLDVSSQRGEGTVVVGSVPLRATGIAPEAE